MMHRIEFAFGLGVCAFMLMGALAVIASIVIGYNEERKRKGGDDDLDR